MTNKKIVEEALKNAKKEEKHHIETLNELEKEDKEFNKEAKKLKKLLTSLGKKI